MARTFADYERSKARAGRIDFEDMLGATIDLRENDADAAAIVRARKRWFSVDEYQDTNPLQERLLTLWAGDRPHVCVVGDEDQTIYSFTGASSGYLRDFSPTPPGHPGADRRRDRPARDCRPRPDERPAGADRVGPDDRRDPLRRPRRPVLRAARCPGRDPGDRTSEGGCGGGRPGGRGRGG